jgi:hypothetical protein
MVVGISAFVMAMANVAEHSGTRGRRPSDAERADMQAQRPGSQRDRVLPALGARCARVRGVPRAGLYWLGSDYCA